jgi:hypothetical protein
MAAIRPTEYSQLLKIKFLLNTPQTMDSVGFEVLTAVSTKMAVFWVVLCSLVEVNQCFLLIVLMMEAARTSETLVNVYQTTRRYNPEESYLNGQCSTKLDCGGLNHCHKPLENR